MPLCTPASCRGRTPSGRHGDSLHRSTDEQTTVAMAGRSQKFSGQYWGWLVGGDGGSGGGGGGGCSGKAPHGFCVAEGAPIEGASVAAAAPMLFLFSALRTFGICVRASQRSPSIAFPQHPLLSLPPLPPILNLQGLPRICIKMKSCRDRMPRPYSSGWRGRFSISHGERFA